MPRFSLILIAAVALPCSRSEGSDIVGRVEMPAACMPTVSPAAVYLESLDGAVRPTIEPGIARSSLVNQRGLQFEPRVRTASLAHMVRFLNEDAETHNIHVISPGADLNRTASPGIPIDFTPEKAGVVKIVCDIHSHMRGYIVVAETPWITTSRADGRFFLRDVPPGRYKVKFWHEMGPGTERVVELKADERLDLGAIRLDAAPTAISPTLETVPIRSWPEVIDRVAMLLSESRATATRPGKYAEACKLAEDAYWEEFEGSDMETAVRRYLGYERTGELERLFRSYRSLVKPVSNGSRSASEMAEASRRLIIELTAISSELRGLGITDRSKIDDAVIRSSAAAFDDVEIAKSRRALADAFEEVRARADQGEASEASFAVSTAYWSAFEPLERIINTYRPRDVAEIELEFNRLRGEAASGLKGEALGEKIAALETRVDEALRRRALEGAASFPAAFAASLLTIMREGVEVILLLSMLLAIASKAGRPEARTAVRRGVALAVVASLLTAVGLNVFVTSAQGRVREALEGWVLLSAAGVLFYVSYWLISQTESKRWSEFLKETARKGAEAGGFATLGLSAFLAVYREGAETALMFQALAVGQKGSSAGMLGLILGVSVGLGLLLVIYRVIRGSTRRLPIRAFFQVTGGLLFLMATVFAGHGVFELQQAGFLKVTKVDWLGDGIVWLGLYPSTQALSIQGLLLFGAAAALLVLGLGRLGERSSIALDAEASRIESRPASVGAY